MKIKGFKTPLAILIVLLLLAGLAYWDEKKDVSDKVASDNKAKLYDFKATDIVEIIVNNPQTEPPQWTLVKDAKAAAGQSWQVTDPIVYAADSEGVERFLKILTEAKYERQFDQNEKDLAGFGLSPAHLSYTLKDKSGKTWLFAMGGKSPTGYASYLKTTDPEHVFLVNQYLFTAANKGLVDFRNRSLFVPLASDVESVEMVWPNLPALKAVRREKDWEITTPLVTKGDTAEITKLLNGWDQVRVVDFIDSPVPELRQALTEVGKSSKEYVTANFTTKDGKVKSLRLIENNEKLYVQFAENTFAEVNKAQVDALKRSPVDLQDRSMFSFVTAEVTDLEVDAKHYHKVDKRWVEGAENKRADYVQGMLVSLEFAKADLKLDPVQGQSLTKGPALQTVTVKQGSSVAAQFSVWVKSGSASGIQDVLIIKTAENYYQVKPDFLEIFVPKVPEGAPTVGGELKQEKS